MAASKSYQRFRSRDTVIRIQAHQHPGRSGCPVIIWSDIQACFPGVVRIQDQDIYVPFERDDDLYRIKPHGIKYRPDAILDVIYRDDKAPSKGKSYTKTHPLHSHATTLPSGNTKQPTYPSPVPIEIPSSVTSSPELSPGIQSINTEHDNDSTQGESEIVQSTTPEGTADPPRTTLEDPSYDAQTQTDDQEDSSDVSVGLLTASKSQQDTRAHGTISRDEFQDAIDSDGSERSGVTSSPDSEIIDTSITTIVPTSAQDTSDCTFTVEEIMQHRIKGILARRYTWLESPCPKLFTILPVKDFDISRLPTLSMFRVHFLCDCGGVTKIDGEQDMSPPHLPAREEPYVIKSDNIISKYGTYMMAVLEMMFYMKLVTLDKRTVERIRYAVTFLLTKRIQSSIRFHDRKIRNLDEVPVIEPLDNTSLKDLYTQHLVDAEQPLGGFRAFQTDQGDIRWVCILHLSEYAPNTVFERPTRFLGHPSSLRGAYWASLGIFRVIVKDRERAKDLYQLIQSLVSVPVMSFFLDWDVLPQDVVDLAEAVSLFPTSCIMINVREDPIDNTDPWGLGHPYNPVVKAAFNNPRIQAFSLEKRKLEINDEFSSFERSFYLGSVIVKFKRDLKTPSKTMFAGLVTDMDGALGTLRASLEGLDRFSELTLEVGFWDQATIKFATDLDGYELVNSEDWFSSDARHMEAIELRAYSSTDTVLLDANCLTDVMINFKFPADGPKIRSMIKNNTRLKKLELSITEADDACQIFEYFKALLANHPSLDSFHISQEHFHARTSVYTWEGVADRAKMTLGIECSAEDRIGTMLQKFASCLTTLMIYGLGLQEALILEKVLRPKKGPFKLRSIFLLNVCALSVEAMESLKKIVLRDTAPEFSISGSVDTKEIGPLADFLIAVAPKVTRLHLYGQHVREIYMELENRMPNSAEMERLTELLISGPLKVESVENEMKWLRSILKKPVPLTTLEIKSADLGHDGWMMLVKEVDFTGLSDLIISPARPIKIEVLEAIVDAVPENSSLGAVVVTCEEMPQARREEFREILLKKMKNGSGSNKGLVMINGFIR
ncbi:hypothetical protein BG006_008300 [Podila minutissima]|uniref:Uncharacterized protein n=1 Tax=Podila minutissima TaxID=64525 RepID=A0A9P5SJY0_9FUNG|nr:hypothetical protein BG006_008300 [Podila minutissima]